MLEALARSDASARSEASARLEASERLEGLVRWEVAERSEVIDKSEVGVMLEIVATSFKPLVSSSLERIRLLSRSTGEGEAFTRFLRAEVDSMIVKTGV